MERGFLAESKLCFGVLSGLGLEVDSEARLELVSEEEAGLAVFGGVYCVGWLRLRRMVLGFKPREEEWPIVSGGMVRRKVS